jgi:hypothetical protein
VTKTGTITWKRGKRNCRDCKSDITQICETITDVYYRTPNRPNGRRTDRNRSEYGGFSCFLEIEHCSIDLYYYSTVRSVFKRFQEGTVKSIPTTVETVSTTGPLSAPETATFYSEGDHTSRLQVMDVGLNKPFKDRVRDQYDEWFMTVPSGSKPQRSDVATWVAKSWLDLPTSAVARSPYHDSDDPSVACACWQSLYRARQPEQTY